MAYALIDDQFHSNPKVLAMGLDGAGLYARALSYCADYQTDGYVPHTWAKQAAGSRRGQQLLNRLSTVGAWIPVDAGDGYEVVDRSENTVTISIPEAGYIVPDFLHYNPSSIERERTRKTKARAGRKGAIKRWADSSSHSTAMADANSTAIAPAMADATPPARAPAHSPAPIPQEPKDFEGEEPLESHVHEISQLAQGIGRPL
jgi:hypothetical protein